MNWFWHAMWIAFVIIPVAILWVTSLVDLMARPDMSFPLKAVWIVAIFVLPVIGSLVYLATSPRPHTIDVRTRQESGSGTVSDIERLAGLHRSGALTDSEFAAAKSRLLSAPQQRGPERTAAYPEGR